MIYSDITEVEMKCKYGWIGTVWNCKPDVDGDGSLGCPECLKVIEVIIKETFYGFCEVTNQSESLITYDNSN